MGRLKKPSRPSKDSHVDAFRNEMAKNPIEIEAHFYEANEISYPGE
jgi:hypothetical protein